MDERELVSNIVTKILEEHAELDRLDSICGDGETGTNLSRGAHKISEYLETTDTPSLKDLGMILNSAGCGTLGTLWSFILLRVSKATTIGEALLLTEEAFSAHSKAKIGEKTMADSLLPWLNSIHQGKTFDSALKEAEAGFERTAEFKGTKGRARYAGEKAIGTKDPGAYATLLVLRELTTYLKSKGSGIEDLTD